MELRHLRYFSTVAETLNFSRAAEQLNMAQPPLSQQIRALENELQVTLFDRTKRPLQLTPAGQVFFTEVEAVLKQVDRAAHIAQQASRGEIGQLMIGVNSAAMQTRLPDLLRQFREQFPQITLNLRELSSHQQLEHIDTDQIDCGFLHTHQQHQFNTHLLFQETLVVTLPQTHPLANQDQVPLSTLINETFILPPPQTGQGLSYQVLQLCEAQGFTPTMILEARHLQTVLGLVVSGLGIALVPASTQNLQRTGVVYRPLDHSLTIETLLVWKPNNPSPALNNFLTLALNFAAPTLTP